MKTWIRALILLPLTSDALGADNDILGQAARKFQDFASNEVSPTVFLALLRIGLVLAFFMILSWQALRAGHVRSPVPLILLFVALLVVASVLPLQRVDFTPTQKPIWLLLSIVAVTVIPFNAGFYLCDRHENLPRVRWGLYGAVAGLIVLQLLKDSGAF